MDTRVVELGAVSRKTRDYSGIPYFDNLTFTFWRLRLTW